MWIVAIPGTNNVNLSVDNYSPEYDMFGLVFKINKKAKLSMFKVNVLIKYSIKSFYKYNKNLFGISLRSIE